MFMLKLQHIVDSFDDEYWERKRVAEEHRERETAAAVRIQAHARGWLQRRYLGELSARVELIQRWYRGHMGRKRARALLRERQQRERREYFALCASTIQRWWRGYWSRKKVVDFYKRKEYLTEVKIKGRKILAEGSKIAEEAARIAEEEHERRVDADMAKLLRRINHLRSTACQEGALMLPVVGLEGLEAPGGHYLEATILQETRSSLKLPPLTGRRPLAPQPPPELDYTRSSISHLSQAPPPGSLPSDMRAFAKHPPMGRTVRTSEVYDRAHEVKYLEDRVTVGGMMFEHARAFRSAVAKPRLGPLTSLKIAEQYRQEPLPNAPPGLRSDKPTDLAAKISHRPFMRAVHNKGVFDPYLI
ncbi:unnamed protein product [Pedinophyceae sp. YPF-701]|nr:unnamed protein product [Pedinophyceae sp. YPF-701]